jgi:hypothetical protein
MPSSAYLSSRASITWRATGPYWVNTLRFLTRLARSRRVSGGMVVRHVQQQVERVEVLAGVGDFIGQRFDQHALALQFFDERGLAVGVVPGLQELVERVVSVCVRLMRV